jgi:hypothetical protein
MSESVLTTRYVDPERPYSQNELSYNRKQLYKRFRLGAISASHRRCQHFYLVKINGRKEKEIIAQDNMDSGNCSVCWKLNKTPHDLKEDAYSMVECYKNKFESEPELLSHGSVDIENVFYKWLYLEFNE